jgi:hypothetical protein
MTRTISLIIGIAVASLAVGVPAALGQLVGSDHGDATQAKIATLSPLGVESIRDSGDATQAQLTQRIGSQPNPLVVRDDGDATQAKLTQRIGSQPNPLVVRDHGDAIQAKLAPRPEIVSRVVAEASSGSGVNWPQFGIGLGVGIALAFGLMLMFRATRQHHPLAH